MHYSSLLSLTSAGGFARGAGPLWRGEPAARQVPALFAGARPASGVGGTRPPRLSPGRGNGKGEDPSISNPLGGDRLSSQLEGHFIVATTAALRSRALRLESARLHTIAAQLHVAPAAGMIFARIQKQPSAVGITAIPHQQYGF